MEKLSIVNEVGTFGSIDMDDPTVKDLTKSDEPKSLEEQIKEAILSNKSIIQE